MRRFFSLVHGMPQQEVFHVTCVALEVRCWFCSKTEKPNSPVKNPWDKLCLMAFESLESKKRCNVFPASCFIPALVAGIRGDWGWNSIPGMVEDDMLEGTPCHALDYISILLINSQVLCFVNEGKRPLWSVT